MTPADRRLITASPLMERVLQRASLMARAPRPVVIFGERGTGKDLVADRLHYFSKRWGEPFVKVNCGALSESLLDAQLFGAELGAYTGAVRRQVGLFERASGGTLFLDEIAHASLVVQQKVLRVVEHGELERLGSSVTQRVDVRIVAATNQNLHELAKSGRFLPDLLDRLGFETLHIPPLRDRLEDIAPLAEHFAHRMNIELQRAWIPALGEEFIGSLMAHDWPGNVRELRNTVEREVYLLGEEPCNLQHPVQGLGPRFSAEISACSESAEAALGGGEDESFKESSYQVAKRIGLRQMQDIQERDLLEKALVETRYKQKAAAALLSLSYDQLRGALRKHGIDLSV